MWMIVWVVSPSRQVLKDESAGTSPSPEILSRERLLQLFRDLSPVPEGGLTTVGLVGYPNVGKSSTINVLYEEKKVPVSATPGRTKHFQTLLISELLQLCDCPGLVFPSLVSTKAEMVVSGILPIDQMRDHTPPVSLVCHRIPRYVLERVYGIRLPQPSEGEDPSRYPTALELLSAYGYLHGYMTSHGQPDCPRSARYILKDYVKGKLLYCHTPPGVTPETFNSIPTEARAPAAEGVGEGGSERGVNSPSIDKDKGEGKSGGVTLSEFDKQFMEQVKTVSKTV
ncbi:Large subunit GTPase 1 homolog [Geodia barretti]|uniref:Large subunit GTPase 1 homolog n=1 Tax=Geodia barretti TaxID=519541 RepID=A0AA35W4X7_GEOBA|nr:Large subunit GTPase 1 homolog [Geodia barretti]